MLMLNRLACLGWWVLAKKFGVKHEFNNQQKIRVDMFMDIVDGKEKIPNIASILPNLLASDWSHKMYLDSIELKWLNINKPDILIMDNFAELVDRRIIHKDGWKFCGYRSDFKEEYFLDGTLTDCGLLNIDDIYNSYDSFFSYVKEKWNVPIIFMHFPTVFEDREKYIKQGAVITEALEKLSPKYNIQNIHAAADSIEQKDDSPLNYHFGNKTVENMANKIIW